MKNYIKNIFSKKDKINAGWAFFAFAARIVGFFVGCGLARFVVYNLALIDAGRKSSLDIKTWLFYEKAFEQPIILVGSIMSLVFLVVVARRIFSDLLKDRSMIGAAWVVGRARDIFLGIFVGAILAVLFFYISNVVNGNSLPTEQFWQFLAKESAYAGGMLIIATIDGVIVGPITEELMYRGIILAGFNKSFGLIWGGILTTMFFILIHGSRLGSLTFLIELLGTSIAFLLIRLRTGAIGPAIALHSTFNFATLICQGIPV
jgi:membrane protease YdiL (CAAX protease family)